MKTMQKVTWTEHVSRRVVRSLISTFPSVAGAVKELVDNAVDRADGQMVEVFIRFDRAHEKIVVESDGGQGMGAEEIARWLMWGANNHESEEEAGDIGFYGQGGKAAAGFLARDVTLWTKRRGSKDVWHLHDPDWANRTEVKDFGEPRPVDLADAPESVRNAKLGRGHVRIELSRANMDRRWNVDVLKRQLSSTYARMIKEGRLRLIVQSAKEPETLLPFTIPLDESVAKVEIDVQVGAISIKGWAGKLDRKALADPSFRSGLRMYANRGRLISDGEWFGYNWQGKGSLNQLIGEVDVEGLTPNHDKTDFTERADEVWDVLKTEVISQLATLIGDLRHSDDGSATKAEQQTAEAVRKELTSLLRSVTKGRGRDGKPSPRIEDERVRKAVEKMLDPKRQFPSIEVGAWDGSDRSVIANGVLLINRKHPMYGQFNGSKAYIAETAITRMVSIDPDVESVDDFVVRTDALMHRWAERQN